MKRVLFVEDDVILARVYCKALQAAGFEVTHSADGESGLAALQILRPDVILLDLMLPRVSGQDLLRIIRNAEGVKTTPVVVFTSAYREELREELEQLGANRVLSKAEFVPQQVIKVLNELMPGANLGKAGDQLNPEARAKMLSRIRELAGQSALIVQQLNRDIGMMKRAVRIHELRSKVREVADVSVTVGLGVQAYFCEALDTYLVDVSDRLKQLSSSDLRTITQSVDFILEAFDPSRAFAIQGYPTFEIMTLDDDSISRCGIQLALSKIKQKAVECSSAAEALAVCADRAFDLIFMDVEMPDMNGYEVCAQLRRESANEATPVVFVTQHKDLQNRARATVSGGTDVIGKPFNFMELAVKSLLHLLRSKLRPVEN